MTDDFGKLRIAFVSVQNELRTRVFNWILFLFTFSEHQNPLWTMSYEA